MRAIELFAGVGGFRLALERNGHAVVWANEWDKYAAQTYDKNFGGKIDRRDITKITPEEIPAHDLIVGGFPCQAFSIAGKRRGFDETRGTLFFDIARIAAHHKTKYLLLENVKGLLSHDRGRTYATIIRSLDELGYDCQWQVLNSKDFGVPQNRERIIIVGHLRGEPRPQVFPIIGTGGEDIRQLNPGAAQDHRVYATTGISPTLNPAAAAGGAVVPKIVATAIARRGRNGGSQYEQRSDGLANTVRTATGGGSMGMVKVPEATKQGFALAEIGDSINLQQPNSKTRRGRVGHGIANTLDTSQFQHTIDPTSFRLRRLTPVECERLQGFPDGWTEGMSDTQRYKQMGNAVTVNVIQAVAARLPR